MKTDHLEIVELKDKFLTFAVQGLANQVSLDASFDLWKSIYGFAAVPPGEKGEKMAFDLFAKAYHKYTNDVIQNIKAFKVDEARLYDVLRQVKAMLGCDEPLDLVVVYYVGFFDNNAFMAPYHDGRMALCLPIENRHSELYDTMVLAHELTHVVHAKTSRSKGEWLRPLAVVLMQEGLAMKISQILAPGLDDTMYLSDNVDWFSSCTASKTDIIKGVKAQLANQDSNTLFKFTMGMGTTGKQREAYYVAWVLIEKLLDIYCIKSLAHLSETEVVSLITEKFDLIDGC